MTPSGQTADREERVTHEPIGNGDDGRIADPMSDLLKLFCHHPHDG
jgi:hypothetical protein